MHPFASQLLGWRAPDPEKRAAALVLEVKGDFCHDIRKILAGAGRGDDYVELSMDGRWYWNPLAAPWLDSYSLAYTISSLLNQLFGKGKDPFWQQAYTNLVRWIIELHRVLPGGWVTLQDVYRCTISPALLAAKIEKAEQAALRGQDGTLQITRKAFANAKGLDAWKWTPIENTDSTEAAYSVELRDKLIELKVNYEEDWPQSKGAGQERVELVWAVQRWYREDWMKLDNKVRSSVVEGVAVFLSMFDLPEVAKMFCPGPPQKWDPAVEAKRRAAVPDPDDEITSGGGVVVASIKRHLPPMDELIEGGKVLALNMPVGVNPALARSIGVMLKNAWLQTLLRRPAWMKESPERYFRPAVFICDEYQSFASVGEDDPSGDEKAFALTRQCRVIPIVATQSISSLRSVLGSSEAWRTLLQTLRTRIFLSLSDDASARIASELCGQVAKKAQRLAQLVFGFGVGQAGIRVGSRGLDFRVQRRHLPRDQPVAHGVAGVPLPRLPLQLGLLLLLPNIALQGHGKVASALGRGVRAGKGDGCILPAAKKRVESEEQKNHACSRHNRHFCYGARGQRSGGRGVKPLPEADPLALEIRHRSSSGPSRRHWAQSLPIRIQPPWAMPSTTYKPSVAGYMPSGNRSESSVSLGW